MESVEHHRGTLWNDKGENVTNRSCKVLRYSYGQVCRHINLSSSDFKNRTRPSTPYAYDEHNYISRSHTIITIARSSHWIYITNKCAHATSYTAAYESTGFPVIPYNMSKPAISRNNLHDTIACTSSWLQPLAQLSYMHTIIYGSTMHHDNVHYNQWHCE